jgi:hypothetical protein
MIKKLNKIIKQTDKIEIEDRAGIKYSLDLFVPYGVLYVQEKLINEKKSQSEIQLAMVEAFLISQYDFMDAEWLKKNISAPHQIALFQIIMSKSNEGLRIGIQENLELEVKPKKKGIFRK